MALLVVGVFGFMAASSARDDEHEYEDERAALEARQRRLDKTADRFTEESVVSFDDARAFGDQTGAFNLAVSDATDAFNRAIAALTQRWRARADTKPPRRRPPSSAPRRCGHARR